MHRSVTYPDFVIIDLGPAIRHFNTYGDLKPFFKKVPVHKVIELILLQPLYDSKDNELIWLHVEQVAEEVFATQNLVDYLDLFFDLVAQQIDFDISIQFPEYMDNGDYLFDTWLDKDSVILYRSSTPTI